MASVLVIEDEDLIRDVVWKFLSGAGHEVVSAPDRATGLAALQKRPFEVTFVDLHLPDSQSFDIISAVREHRPHTRIVVITGVLAVTLDKVKPYGAEAILYKPFLPEEMVEVVQALTVDAG